MQAARARAAAPARAACALARRRHRLGAAPARRPRARVADPALGGGRRRRRLVVAEGRDGQARARRARRARASCWTRSSTSRMRHGVRVRGRRGAAGRARAATASCIPARRCTSTCATCTSRRSRRRCRTASATAPSSPGDLAERVAIHRDVWAPSRVTEESYANVMAAWPYRASLDCVVEAPGRPLRRVLPRLAGGRERGRRAGAGRRARGVPPARPRRGGLHVRAAAPLRRGRPPGGRLLRHRAGVRALSSRSASAATRASSGTRESRGMPQHEPLSLEPHRPPGEP